MAGGKTQGEGLVMLDQALDLHDQLIEDGRSVMDREGKTTAHGKQWLKDLSRYNWMLTGLERAGIDALGAIFARRYPTPTMAQVARLTLQARQVLKGIPFNKAEVSEMTQAIAKQELSFHEEESRFTASGKSLNKASGMALKARRKAKQSKT